MARAARPRVRRGIPAGGGKRRRVGGALMVWRGRGLLRSRPSELLGFPSSWVIWIPAVRPTPRFLVLSLV